MTTLVLSVSETRHLLMTLESSFTINPIMFIIQVTGWKRLAVTNALAYRVREIIKGVNTV
jgi:hypothetical protein